MREKTDYETIVLGGTPLVSLRCLKTWANLPIVVRVGMERLKKDSAHRLTANSAFLPSFMYLEYGTYRPARTTESSPRQTIFMTARADRLISAPGSQYPETKNMSWPT